MKPKFNFTNILLNSASTEEKNQLTANLNKNGQFIVSKNAAREFGFNGKIINLVWDSHKRALGWKKVDGNLAEEHFTKTMRLLTPDKTGTIKFSIGRLMQAVGIEKENYPKMPIEKYVDNMEDREIYYVQIPKKEVIDNA